jgi:hypothetical protein
MTPLNVANSGCASNSSAVSGSGISVRVPVSSDSIGPSAIRDTFLDFSSQLFVSHSATYDLFHNHTEPLGIRIGSMVVSECLFVQVAKQMERLDADVGTMQAAFQKTPEVLHRVRVDVTVNVLYRVIYDGVLIVGLQPVIGLQFVTEDSGACFDPLTNGCLQFFLRAAGNVPGYNLTAALHHSEDDLFVLAARAGNLFGPLGFVHIAGLAADECFVYFNFATKLIECSILHRKANPVQHEPCGLLSDAETTMDLIATDSVFAVDDKPRGREPLFEGQWGILEDCSRLEREGGFKVSDIAFPYARLSKPRYSFGAALRALYRAIRPAQLHHEFAAMLEVREVDDRVSEGCFAVHDPSLPEHEHNVKYIIALIRS